MTFEEQGERPFAHSKFRKIIKHSANDSLDHETTLRGSMRVSISSTIMFLLTAIMSNTLQIVGRKLSAAALASHTLKYFQFELLENQARRSKIAWCLWKKHQKRKSEQRGELRLSLFFFWLMQKLSTRWWRNFRKASFKNFHYLFSLIITSISL